MRLLVTLALGAFQIQAAAQADAGAGKPLSLSEAREAAIERNWDLLAAKSGIDTATAQLLVTKEFPNPTFSFSSAKIGNHDSATPAGNSLWTRNYDTIFAVNQLIEIGGKRHDRQAAARAGVLGSKARFWDAKRLLDQGVTKAYVNALLLTENSRVLRESASSMQHEAEIAAARFRAGDLAKTDLQQIEVAAEQYILQSSTAEAAATQACIALEVLMGVNQPTGKVQFADSLEQINGSLVSVTIEQTNALRPDVIAAESDVRAAEANLKLQKAVRIPDPTISFQYEHNPPGGGPPTDTMGFGVSFPLPLWNRNGGAISSAKAALEQSNLALAKIRAAAESDLANAEVSHREAAERLKRYQEQIRPKSASARDSIIYKFEKGGATLVDLLEAERTDNDVRIATQQALADTASALADIIAAKTALTVNEINSEH